MVPTYTTFNSNWFGIVFNDSMNGNSLVYTTGKEDEYTMPVGLHAYDLNGYELEYVIRNADKDWIEISSQNEDGIVDLQYAQTLNKTQWDRDSNQIIFKAAFGESLILDYHVFRSEETYTLNLTATESILPTIAPSDDNSSPIICNGEGYICSETTLSCDVSTNAPIYDCVISCQAPNACYKSTFQCLPGQSCLFQCIDDEACSNATIQCEENSNCEITGDFGRSVINTEIECAQDANCTVDCKCPGACSELAIYAQDASLLNIYCNNASCIAHHTIMEINDAFYRAKEMNIVHL